MSSEAADALLKSDGEPWIRPIRASLLEAVRREYDARAVKRGRLSGDDLTAVADTLLQEAVGLGASDVHLATYSDRFRIRVRVDGVLVDVVELPLVAGRHLIRHFMVMADLDPVKTFAPLDARQTRMVGGREIDLRLAYVPCITGEKLAIRLLDPQRLERRVGDLGLCEAERQPIDQWLVGTSGMLLVTGPTGSGKTTTLCALLHELKMAERSVVTIEDPVEYQIDGIAQIQVDERHGLTFAEGLRAMLRLDPDYLLLGEIRDGETAQVAVEACSTGRVLMSTLHCRDAFGAVTSLRNWNVPDHEIIACLEMVVAQRLVRKLCPLCRQLGPPSDTTRLWLASLALPIPEQAWLPVGCPACRQLGYFGRVGVFEVWRLRQDDYRLILSHADEHSIREAAVARGHRPLLTDALSMAAEGITSFDELKVMGSVYVPPPQTPAAQAVEERLGQ